MSRKSASFEQLSGYMDAQKSQNFEQLSHYMNSEKSDERYDLYHNLFSQGQKNIAEEFLKNSEFLKKRKNGNFLYHEILSISLEKDVALQYAKDSLRSIALEYISKRCPNNLVYACLHEDHTDHLHYHLMISANQRGEATRVRLKKTEFDTIKRDLENHVLVQYPKLKQRKVITASNKEKKISRKASDQKRRTGRLDRQEAVRDMIQKAMKEASSFEVFKSYLADNNFIYGTRGKNYKVTVTHNNGKVVAYRFATIGVHNEFERYLDRVAPTERYQDSQKRARRNKKEGGDAEQAKKSEDGAQTQYKSKADAAADRKSAEQKTKNSNVKNKQQSSEPFESKKTEKSAFAQDVENIYEKKKIKKAKKKTKTLNRKSPKR